MIHVFAIVCEFQPLHCVPTNSVQPQLDKQAVIMSQ